MGHSPAKNLRALSFSICWLSVSPNSIAPPSVAARQPEHEMPDNVALNFRSPGFDRISAASQVAVRPQTVVNRFRIALHKLAIRPEQLLRKLLHALIEFAPENLLNRSLRPRDPRRRDA